MREAMKNRGWMTAAAAAAMMLAAVTAQAVTIDLVPVSNTGNLNNLYTGRGAVPYEFQMGQYEITAGQYCEFLNAVATTSDPYGLWYWRMWDVDGCKILSSGFGEDFPTTYTVADDRKDRPVSSISFWDAARFANWLHNGQGIGGDTETGAYTLNGYMGGDGRAITRNPGAKWWIPSVDEWVKAAYHKNNGDTGDYWDFPTGTHANPGRDLTETTNSGNNANFKVDSVPIDAPYYTTEKGEFELSDSPYGTFDQGGNVMEWFDTVMNPAANGNRRMGGGSWWSTYDGLLINAIAWTESSPNGFNTTNGFRVATVIPEPGGIAMLAGVALTGLLYWWRRRTA